jgi:hypothetical protein
MVAVLIVGLFMIIMSPADSDQSGLDRDLDSEQQRCPEPDEDVRHILRLRHSSTP